MKIHSVAIDSVNIKLASLYSLVFEFVFHEP